MRYVPFILYTIGTLFFFAGSVLAMWQLYRGV